MIDHLPTYYSKILLFGEYTLLMGSGALTVPFPKFNGRLEFSNDCTVEHSVSNNHLRKLMEEISLLSELQFEYFEDMIPEKYKNIWRNGIDSGDYFLKLCGSGGGGFILGFASDFQKADSFFRNRDEKVLPVFKNS